MTGMIMTHIVIYTDFDGTLTGKVGSATVFSPFYQSLLAGYSGKVQDYKQTPMKPNEELQQLFVEKFGLFKDGFDYSQNDTEMLMSADAVLFLHELLKNDQVTINIITKNRADYITALLKYQGFSEEEINKISIQDSGYKFDAVSQSLHSLKERASYLYILDDDKSNDYPAMYRAAQMNSYHADHIRGYNELPGQFNWSVYQNDILMLLANKGHNAEAKIEIGSEHHDTPVSDALLSTEATSNIEQSVSKAHLSPVSPSDIEAPTTLKAPLKPEADQPLLVDEDPSNDNESSNDGIYPERTKPLLSGTIDIPAPSETSSYRNVKITGISAAIGFFIGFTIGILLVASSLFAPFGAGILGALALGGTFAACTGILTGLGGYIGAIGTALKTEPITKNETSITPEDSNKAILSHLLDGASSKPASIADVAHFPSVFANKPAQDTTEADYFTSSLNNTMSKPGQ